MKRVLVGLLILFITIVSCDYHPSSDEITKRETERMMKEANSQTGLPAIKNWQEKKLVKMLYEIRDKENLITYAYIVNLKGELVFIGKCVGYGMPYSVQYSNPEKIEGRASVGYITLPQPEPNGLFMPEGLSATWLLILDDKGEPHPVYIEPEIIVSPFKLK